MDEAQLFANPKLAKKDDLKNLMDGNWEKYRNEKDIRERQKIIRKAGYFAAWMSNMEDIDKAELEISLMIMREEKRVSPAEHLGKDLPKAVAKWLEMMGLGEPVIKSEVKGTVAVESGVIAAGDPELGIQGGEDYLDAGLKKLADQGRQLSIATEGDGPFGVRIRLIEGKEPVLKKEEYKNLSFSEAGVLRVESGKLVVADLWGMDQKGSVAMTLSNGEYKTEAYYFESGRFCGVVVVLVQL